MSDFSRYVGIVHGVAERCGCGGEEEGGVKVNLAVSKGPFHDPEVLARRPATG